MTYEPQPARALPRHKSLVFVTVHEVIFYSIILRRVLQLNKMF